MSALDNLRENVLLADRLIKEWSLEMTVNSKTERGRVTLVVAFVLDTELSGPVEVGLGKGRGFAVALGRAVKSVDEDEIDQIP